MSAKFSGNIYRGLFIKEGSNLIRLEKMKVDDNPFPGDQNMVDARLLKGKTKVLTSIKSRVARTVNPERQISADEIQGN